MAYVTNAHLARAMLEAIWYQRRDLADAMTADSGVTLDAVQAGGPPPPPATRAGRKKAVERTLGWVDVR